MLYSRRSAAQRTEHVVKSGERHAPVFSRTEEERVPPALRYENGAEFPRPTPQGLDSLQAVGVVPYWLQENPSLASDYWPRASFTVAGSLTNRHYMTQALADGFGGELSAAIPLGFTDDGLGLFVGYDDLDVRDPGWLRWSPDAQGDGHVYDAGVATSLGIPLKWSGWSVPLGIDAGVAWIRTDSSGTSETYATLEPGVGVRWRMTPRLAAHGMIRGSWLASLSSTARSIGAWQVSLGIDVALHLVPDKPLQPWVPPLVVTAADAVELLSTRCMHPLNVIDRNLDFINTELKPLTKFQWYPLGFRAIVRGTIMQSSRASSGNVTALDIRIDSTDQRGFRVWRTAFLVRVARGRGGGGNPAGADSSVNTEARRRDSITAERIRHGDYAFRSDTQTGYRYVRVELFPRAKGALDSIPKAGSRVEILGELMWDGDGHVEVHPRQPQDIRVIEGKFLDSDDPMMLE